MNSDLASSVGRMQRLANQLADKWEETKSHWNDQTAREFEREYLRSILPQLSLTAAAVHHMNEMLGQAQRDCDEETTWVD